MRIPGPSLLAQFEILFITTLAMSVTCLAISSVSRVAGTGLPAGDLSRRDCNCLFRGPCSRLPEIVSTLCRPFIAAYWGWSGYLKTLAAYRHYDIVRQSTNTHIADFNECLLVLSMHALVCAVVAWIFVARSFSRR